MSMELPLSMRILLVLNPSNVKLWTRGRHEAASLFWRILPRKTCPCPFIFASREVFCGCCSLASDTILKGFEWPTCGWPACDRLYLPNHTWRTLGRVILVPWWGFTLVLIIILGPTRFSLLHKPLQFPFSYEFFYLLLQIPTILCVVAVILMETTVLLLATHIMWRM